MTSRSHLSRLALAAGALLVAPTLASCGFDNATDRVNTISAGVNDRDGDIDVLGAVIIAGQPDLGLFVATLVNNSDDGPSSLDGLTATEEVAPIGTAGPVEVTRSGRVNLIESGGLPVSGTFAPGDFVEVTLGFSGGQVTTLEVPVVTPCHQYEPERLGLELPTGAEGVDNDLPQTGTAEFDCEPLPPIDPHAEAEGEVHE